MRIVFLGTPELAVPSLAAVAERHKVTAIVTQPDRPKGRSKTPQPPPVKQWALDHDIPVHQPVKLNDGAFEAWLRGQAPEVCCLAAYGRILKQPILDVPEHGFLNVHPSLLPRHRGVAPIQGALLAGDDVTGVTIMRLDSGIDTGDIVLQRQVPIAPDDNTESLSERLARVGAELLVEAVDRLERGEATFTPQNHDQASHTQFLSKESGRIDWSRPANELHNLVRATAPWPLAQTGFRGTVARVHRSEVLPEPTTAAPGTVTAVESDRVLVATGAGQLAILEFQVPGKRAMAMADFLRGHPIEPGEHFAPLA